MSLHAWIKAWEASMAESGYPRARLTPQIEEDGTWSYGWMEDVDQFAAATMGEFPLKDLNPRDGWHTAHLAFILVDRLRPDWMNPSPILAEMLGDQ